MGDWNTLHLFNDRYFYQHLVPDFKDKGNLFKHYIDSQLGKYILYNKNNSEERTQRLVEFSRQLRPDYKVHETYYEIQSRQKKPTEIYAEFIAKNVQDDDDFRDKHANVIEELNLILTLVIFSECGAFNPHLILGRRIFSGNVHAKPKSIAEELIGNIHYNETGSPYYSNMSNCNGITNWITYEELQYLWFDRDSLFTPPDGSEEYLQEFLAFIELALLHECGLIAVTNVNEGMLNIIENPRLKINIDPKQKGWKSVITFTGR